MPLLHRMLFTVALSAMLLGCGGDKSPLANDPTAAPQPAAQTPAMPATIVKPAGESTPVSLAVNAESTPSDVVLAFLNAMRDGNSAVASGLLTDLAQAETTKHQWPVQPPGAPSATYQLGQPSFVDAQQTGVHVPCLWTEPDGAGGTIKFEVVWALRRLDAGWRVAGFATEIVPGKPPFFFNFEDIANLKETQVMAEAALAEASAAESAVPNVAGQPNSNTSTR